MTLGERCRLKSVKLRSVLILQQTCFGNLLNLLNCVISTVLYLSFSMYCLLIKQYNTPLMGVRFQ